MSLLKRLLDGTTGLVRTCFMGVSGTNYKLLFRFLPDWHPQLKEYRFHFVEVCNMPQLAVHYSPHRSILHWVRKLSSRVEWSRMFGSS